jgi:hypothetical protein
VPTRTPPEPVLSVPQQRWLLRLYGALEPRDRRIVDWLLITLSGSPAAGADPRPHRESIH